MTSTIGKFRGVQIDMSGLQEIHIQPEGQTAWFQGGTFDGQVMEYLWDQGYVASRSQPFLSLQYGIKTFLPMVYWFIAD